MNESKMRMGEFTLDNHKYQCGIWDIDTATDTLTKLVKLLGEPLVMVLMGAAEGHKKNGGEGGLQGLMKMEVEDLPTEAIASAFKGLAMRLNEKEVKELLRLCCGQQLLCDGKQVVYDQHFMGRIGLLLKCTIQVLRHQYKDFLGGSLDLGK